MTMDDSIFSSVTFGLFGVILTGMSWSVIGTIMSDAPKHGVRAEIYQGVSALFGIVVGIIGTICAGGCGEIPVLALYLYFFVDVLANILNFTALLLMSTAMQTGPNGAIWGIIQSAVIAPFAMGIVFFHVAATPLRFGGIIALVAGLLFFALSQNSKTDKGNSSWRIYTLIAFVATCLQQCLSTLPTYFAVFNNVPAFFRCIGCSTGVLAGFALCIVFWKSREHDYLLTVMKTLRLKYLWKYVFIGQIATLPVSYLLFYPSMRIMSQNNMGSLSYPLTICACILSFSIVAFWHIKEKMTVPQIMALICCTLGIFLFCAF